MTLTDKNIPFQLAQDTQQALIKLGLIKNASNKQVK